ncbi:tyrosinase family protein [Paraburkholderia strydomiana]|uniref:tyrosinase family protein n=1 Tax=Paraburkholderia strydomiana TaxID=1245417 RepID=UPI0038B925E6
MALGDGIRRNIASVDPSERAMLRDALLELNRRLYPGSRSDPVPGGVTQWFKQDEIHQATHVHGGPEFIPWHREIVNRLEDLLRQVNPQLSLHYWDWTQDPTAIPNANLGGGNTGLLNLFTADFMGYGGSTPQPIGPPWQSTSAPWRADGFYVPGANPNRDSPNGTPADPPDSVERSLLGSPLSATDEANILAALDFADMRVLMESAHNAMHGYVRMGGAHISFRDPFVFLLHSGQDRLFARWQTDPVHPDRLDPATVYGRESNLDVQVVNVVQNVNHNVEPWSSGASVDEFGTAHRTRPWFAPESEGVPHSYKDLSVVSPPCYDTNYTNVVLDEVENPGSVINFNDVPEGETTIRSATFRVYACGDVHFTTSAPPAAPYSLLLPPGSITVQHTLAPFNEGRIWFAFTGTTAGTMAPGGTVTIHCVETGQDFILSFTGNTIHRKTVAAVLVLDQSGSMAWDAGTGPGIKRIDVLHEAASRFCDLVQASNGVGLVRFDQSAYPILPVQRFGASAFDPNRTATLTAVNATAPNGATSIGNGVELARTTLNNASGYDSKAMVVFTDGLENTPKLIADVMGMIDAQTFAIGLGTTQQVSTAALKALTDNTGGYLHVSGHLTPGSDDYFLVSKYFLEILASISNTSVVLDPSGVITPGVKVSIPFIISDTDIEATVILMTDIPALRFLVLTPTGEVIAPPNVATFGASYTVGTNMSWYHFAFPVPVASGKAHAGTWHAVLEVDPALYERYAAIRAKQGTWINGVRYSFNVHAYTNLRLTASLSQNSLQPGATLTVHGRLTEYGQPVVNRASMVAEVRRPDATIAQVPLVETTLGNFEANMQAVQSGVYRFRVIANGVTWHGSRFTREQLLTGIAYPGGDLPPPITTQFPGKTSDALCHLLECLIGKGTLKGFFEANHIDPKTVQDCIASYCSQLHAPPTDQELREREGIALPIGQNINVPSDPQLRDVLTKLASLLRASGM